MRLLHLASRLDWEAALASGAYRGSTRGRTLHDEGFVHLSTITQLPGVLASYYADVELADYVLLVVDAPVCAAAGSILRWDTVPGSDVPFPHVYGVIPVTAVVAERSLARGRDGTAMLPDLSSLDVVQAPPITETR